MPYFEYTAIDKNGAKHSGMIEADSGEEAIFELLTNKKVVPVDVKKINSQYKIDANKRIEHLKKFKQSLMGTPPKPKIVETKKVPRRSFKFSPTLIPLMIVVIIAIASFIMSL